jgi:uncharacterized membrane protein YeaQ/YmgE (transglycosylase-associated protein family)
MCAAVRARRQEGSAMPLLSWILMGLVLGYLARFVTRRRMGFLWTLLAGLAGAVVGGFIGRAAGFGGVVDDFSIWSFVFALIVSIIALIVLYMVFPRRRRP